MRWLQRESWITAPALALALVLCGCAATTPLPERAVWPAYVDRQAGLEAAAAPPRSNWPETQRQPQQMSRHPGLARAMPLAKQVEGGIPSVHRAVAQQVPSPFQQQLLNAVRERRYDELQRALDGIAALERDNAVLALRRFRSQTSRSSRTLREGSSCWYGSLTS